MAELRIIDQSGDLTIVSLRGELDSQGVGKVETRFAAAICPAGKNAIVDFSEVGFLASLGIRMLISTARALAGRGARMIIIAPQELVRESLVAASIDQLIPLADNIDDARNLLNAG